MLFPNKMQKFKEFSIEETIKDIKSSPQYCWDDDYILWTAITTPTRGKRAVQLLLDHFNKKAKLLDVGYSQGLTIGYTGQVFPNLEGIDVDADAKKTAQKRLNKLGLKTTLKIYDGKTLPFKDNSFDGIISNEVFEHVDNRQTFVKELHRVLKPHGKLIITTPNKLFPIECEFHLPFLSYLPKKLADLYVRMSGKGKSYDGVNHPFHFEFIGELERYFSVNDITLDVLTKYKKYYLGDERGAIIPLVASVINILKKLNKTPLEPISKVIGYLLLNVSAGWICICTKPKNF